MTCLVILMVNHWIRKKQINNFESLIMENIPPGLQALLNASEMLGISMTAPGPQGEQPTVARQILQQAQMEGVKRQAGIGSMIQAQQQAQKQKEAQDPEALAQRVAMMMRNQGISALPVEMRMAEGGIIGYNGEGTSEVYAPYEAELSAAPARAVTPAEIQSNPRYIELRRQNVPASEAYKQVEKELSQTAPAPSIPTRVPQSLSPAVQVLRDVSGLSGEPESSRVIPPGTVDALRGTVSDTGAQLPPDAKPPAQARPAFTIERSPPEPPVPSVPVGVTPQRPDVSKLGQGIAGLPNYTAQEQRLRKLAEEEEAARARMPDLESQGIAALQQAEQDRRRLLEKQREGDFLKKFIAFGRDLYTRGNEYGVVKRGFELRDQQDVEARLNNEKAILELRRAAQARDLGKFDRQRALEKDAIALSTQAGQNLINAAQIEGRLIGDMYSAEVKALSDARVTNAQLVSRAMEIREMAANRRLTGISSAATQAQAKLVDMLTKLNTQEEARFPMLKILRMTPADKLKDEDRAVLRDALAWRKGEEAKLDLKGAEEQLDALRTRLMMEIGGNIRFDSSGQPIQ